MNWLEAGFILNFLPFHCRYNVILGFHKQRASKPGSDFLNPAFYGNPSYAFAVAGHSNSCEYDSIKGSCHGTLGVKPPPC